MRLELDHLVVAHGGRHLVDVADVAVEQGRPTTIVGESGSGKSLLAHAVMGTLAAGLAARGRMRVGAESFDLADGADRRPSWGRLLALLPQEPVSALDPTMRVRDQVAEGARSFRRDRRAARQAAHASLASVGMAASASAYPHTLSGGMAQRVTFAAATIGEAPVLLVDEPSKGLDRRARDELAALLRRHVDGGGLLLTITHDLALARQLGGDVLVMKDASVVERGPVDEVLDRPTHAYTRRLVAAEPANWRHAWTATGAPTSGTDEPLVRAEGLTKSYAGEPLFEDLSLTVHPGERLALTGPSGSGKTTLGNVVLRLLPPDVGRVHHDPVLAGGRVQKLYQDPALAFPPQVALRTALTDVVRRHRLDPARPASLAVALGLDPDLLARRPGQVSGGELQRVAIVRSMLLDPALLFADEPTSRLDLVTQEQTICALLDQVERHRCALVLVTHDEDLADAVTHRRVALTGGTRPVDVPDPA